MKDHIHKWRPIESPYDFHTNQMYEIRRGEKVIVPDILVREEIMAGNIGLWTCPRGTEECHPLNVYGKAKDILHVDNTVIEQMIDVLIDRLDNGVYHYVMSCPTHGTRGTLSEIPNDRVRTCDVCGKELTFGKVYEKVI